MATTFIIQAYYCCLMAVAYLIFNTTASRVKDITSLRMFIDVDFNETDLFQKDIYFPLSFNRNENTFGGILSNLPSNNGTEYHKLLIEAEGYLYDYEEKQRGTEIAVLFNGTKTFTIETGRLSTIELLLRDQYPPAIAGNEMLPPIISSIGINPSMVEPGEKLYLNTTMYDPDGLNSNIFVDVMAPFKNPNTTFSDPNCASVGIDDVYSCSTDVVVSDVEDGGYMRTKLKVTDGDGLVAVRTVGFIVDKFGEGSFSINIDTYPEITTLHHQRRNRRVTLTFSLYDDIGLQSYDLSITGVEHGSQYCNFDNIVRGDISRMYTTNGQIWDRNIKFTFRLGLIEEYLSEQCIIQLRVTDTLNQNVLTTIDDIYLGGDDDVDIRILPTIVRASQNAYYGIVNSTIVFEVRDMKMIGALHNYTTEWTISPEDLGTIVESKVRRVNDPMSRHIYTLKLKSSGKPGRVTVKLINEDGLYASKTFYLVERYYHNAMVFLPNGNAFVGRTNTGQTLSYTKNTLPTTTITTPSGNHVKAWNFEEGARYVEYESNEGWGNTETEQYSHAYWIQWSSDPHPDWRTLLRHKQNHCAIVKKNSVDLGTYNNVDQGSGTGFQDSGYDITPGRFNVVIVTSNGFDSTFYVDGAYVGTTRNSTCARKEYYRVGWVNQYPGKLAKLAMWKKELTVQEIVSISSKSDDGLVHDIYGDAMVFLPPEQGTTGEFVGETKAGDVLSFTKYSPLPITELTTPIGRTIRAWDFDSGRQYVQYESNSGNWGSKESATYTHAYWMQWNLNSDDWRTLLRHQTNHCLIVNNKKTDLGFFNNIDQGSGLYFRDTHFDIVPGQFNIVVVTSDGQHSKFYVDGAFVGEIKDAHCANLNYYRVGFNEQSPGKLAKMAMWKRPLSLHEIQQMNYDGLMEAQQERVRRVLLEDDGDAVFDIQNLDLRIEIVGDGQIRVHSSPVSSTTIEKEVSESNNKLISITIGLLEIILTFSLITICLLICFRCRKQTTTPHQEIIVKEVPVEIFSTINPMMNGIRTTSRRANQSRNTF